ncbi:MAG: ROK family protein [Cyclobacteriaceae bacterium]
MIDKPTILTLDAGGTNFVFSAMRNRKLLVEPIVRPAQAHDLDLCIKELVSGFENIRSQLDHSPHAVSFAFPGPADYEHGILGNLPNFAAFNGDVPLAAILEHHLKIPVFINNDGDLFAFGEATSGYLPWLNDKLAEANNPKRFKNLIGITLGTGVGAGIVINGQLLRGDNTCAAEIHNMSNYSNLKWNCEESVSTRAIQRIYAEASGHPFNANLLPGDIYKIATGEKSGNREAAINSFEAFGKALGNVICDVVTLIDGIVVLGGGITAGWDLFGAHVMAEINKVFEDFKGDQNPRLSVRLYDLNDEQEFNKFLIGNQKTAQVYGTEKTISFDGEPRVGLGISRQGASRSIMLGAYDYAVSRLG